MVVFCLSLNLSCGRQESQNSKEEQAIRSTVESYTETFNKHDAKALAEYWSEDALYVNPETGDEIKGREEIRKQFEEHFEDNPDAKINITILSLRFPHPDKAIENGLVTVTDEDGGKSRQAYRVTYVKSNGKWLIEQAREVEINAVPIEDEHLKDLSWLIGNWIDEDEDSVNEIHTSWDKYKNFIVQSFSVSVEGFDELEGKQLIAWDPVKKQIRSWIFDSDGSFGEGVWFKQDKSWVAEMTQTMADGRRGSATYIYTPIDADSYKWQATDREIGGNILPDIETVTVKRKAG